MNNNQIVESVSNGVYRAVIDAISTMPQNNGDVVLMIGEECAARRQGKRFRSFDKSCILTRVNYGKCIH